jgi:hypothetical protein
MLTEFESHVQVAKRCAPWKISNGTENLVLQALQFQQMASNFPIYFKIYSQYVTQKNKRAHALIQ